MVSCSSSHRAESAGLKSARPISRVAGVRAQASTSHVQPLADPIVEAALTMLYPERRLLEREASAAYVEMARLVNLVPSCLLVFLGAWMGSGRSLHALILGQTWLMSAISGSIAVASCVLNDFFDYAVDVINEPNKPLPRGSVPLDGALLLSFCLYSAVLISACILEPPLLRFVIAFSAGATLLYTPLLKRMTGIKNISVAAVIALSPVAGALAAGAASAALATVAAPCAYLFCCILHREILMDINDTDGDRASGIPTLPVVLGRRAALGAAALLAAAALGISLRCALLGSGLSWLWALAPSLQPWMRSVSALAALANGCALLRAAGKIPGSGFDKGVVKAAIEGSMGPIGMGLLLTAMTA
ncbi:g6789 [Coccomyxa elongata]